MKYTEAAKEALVEAKVYELASRGKYQYEAARDGWRGVNEMGEEELLRELSMYGIDPMLSEAPK
jgi:hypothetical protein